MGTESGVVKQCICILQSFGLDCRLNSIRSVPNGFLFPGKLALVQGNAPVDIQVEVSMYINFSFFFVRFINPNTCQEQATVTIDTRGEYIISISSLLFFFFFAKNALVQGNPPVGGSELNHHGVRFPAGSCKWHISPAPRSVKTGSISIRIE